MSERIRREERGREGREGREGEGREEEGREREVYHELMMEGGGGVWWRMLEGS